MAARYSRARRRTPLRHRNKRRPIQMVKTQYVRFVVTAMAFATLAVAQDQTGKLGRVGPGLATQRKGAAPEGPTPKMPSGKPDMSGVWTPVNFMTMGGQPALQPWADALYKERRANLR